MYPKKEIQRQIKSSDYPSNTVMDFVLPYPCSEIFVNNRGTTTLDISFKAIIHSGGNYFRQVQVDPDHSGSIYIEKNKFKEFRVETELGHDFKIEAYF